MAAGAYLPTTAAAVLATKVRNLPVDVPAKGGRGDYHGRTDEGDLQDQPFALGEGDAAGSFTWTAILAARLAVSAFIFSRQAGQQT